MGTSENLGASVIRGSSWRRFAFNNATCWVRDVPYLRRHPLDETWHPDVEASGAPHQISFSNALLLYFLSHYICCVVSICPSWPSSYTGSCDSSMLWDQLKPQYFSAFISCITHSIQPDTSLIDRWWTVRWLSGDINIRWLSEVVGIYTNSDFV